LLWQSLVLPPPFFPSLFTVYFGIVIADIFVAIKQNIQLLEKGVTNLDTRIFYRVLKLSNLRKLLSPDVLIQVIRQVYPLNHPSVAQLIALLDKVYPIFNLFSK
jgi:hypothetical protein